MIFAPRIEQQFGQEIRSFIAVSQFPFYKKDKKCDGLGSYSLRILGIFFYRV